MCDCKCNRDLKIGLFATGDYVNTCIRCEKTFTGDKRAMMCLDCAITSIEDLNNWYSCKINTAIAKLESMLMFESFQKEHILEILEGLESDD